jgi:hypothetical protein
MLAQQPENFLAAYRQAAQDIVQALTQPVYSATISIPYGSPRRFVKVHAGSAFYSVLRKPCGPELIQKLHRLMTHPRQEVQEGVQLTCYLAGQQMLSSLPDEDDLSTRYTGFDGQGILLADGMNTAAAIVEKLSRFVHSLNLIEALYPAWRTDDSFSEKHALLMTHLIRQGRALANCHTQKLIREILTAWKAGELTRGLTIFLPFLDERQCRMDEYRIVVIPAGRILFRPEFVVGACRVAERKVRVDSDLSQATRWQLLSQLDAILQAFEDETHFPP